MGARITSTRIVLALAVLAVLAAPVAAEAAASRCATPDSNLTVATIASAGVALTVEG